jgi:hypothetical protein
VHAREDHVTCVLRQDVDAEHPAGRALRDDLDEPTGVEVHPRAGDVLELHEFFRAVGGRGMPTTIFVLPGGGIAEIWVGALDADALQQLVADLFGISA